jgi:feruloyl esterase
MGDSNHRGLGSLGREQRRPVAVHEQGWKDDPVNYYERLVARFGQAVADTFVRFYRIPGFAHGNGLFNAKFDALGALDAWVDGGRAPGTLEAVDINPENHQRRRPMCVYPSWPRYAGTGDVNAASSFRCVTGDDASQTN